MLFLASRRLPGIDRFLAGVSRAALIDVAAEPLPDREAIVGELVAAIPVPLERLAIDRLAEAEAIVVGGGDPYHLLAWLRASRADAAVHAAMARGARYVGVSAGAIVAGPSLEPQVFVSPFAPPPGLDLAGLGLTSLVVLPHRTRAGRAERIAAARARFSDLDLRALADDEVLVT